MLKIVFITFIISFGVQNASKAEVSCQEKPGALIIAHGSHKMDHFYSDKDHDHEHWNETVIAAVSKAKGQLSFPVELAFGMWDKASFEEGVNRLVAKGVCELRIVPLFVSSDSEMIDVQKYMFGVNKHVNFPIPVQKVQIPPQIQTVIYGKALDDHEIVSEILAERISQMSVNPPSEGLIFLGHGPYGNYYESKWLDLLKLHRQRTINFLRKSGLEFAEASELVLRDDSPSSIREERTRQLRAKVEELNQKSITPVIIPVLLSSGGIEKGIFERLKGLNYKIQTQFLMPHAKIVDWIVFSAQ